MSKALVAAIAIVLFFTNGVFAEVIKNIDYAGTGKVEHTLNIYKPDGKGPFPVIIYYTGLAFTWSDAKSDGGMSKEYNAAGFAIVGPNLSGGGSGDHKANYPTQIQELKAAVRFIRANAEKYDLDPKFIGVTGVSSGGWNTVMLATTGDVDEFTVGSTTMKLEGTFGGNLEYSSRIQAGWASCPPTDFSIMNKCGSSMDHDGASSPEGSIIGGVVSQNLEKVALANPITFVSKDDPPLYLRHGTVDNIVPPCESEKLWEAIEAIGNEKDMNFTPQQGQNHGEFPTGRLDFFKRALQNNKEGCLDPESKSFDPLATYCSDGDCCKAAGNPPKITSAAAVSCTTGTTATYTVTATDADNDAVTFTVDGLKTWMSFTSPKLTLKPVAGSSTSEVAVIANDGNGGLDTLKLTVTVVQGVSVLRHASGLQRNTILIGDIRLEIPVCDNFQFDLFTITGKCLYSGRCGGGLRTIRIPTTNVSPGMYLVNVHTPDGSYKQPVLINR